MAIGSIEGTGAVFLGANKLTVGTNNLSTAFSGKDNGLDLQRAALRPRLFSRFAVLFLPKQGWWEQHTHRPSPHPEILPGAQHHADISQERLRFQVAKKL